MCYKCGKEMVYPRKIRHRNGIMYKSNGLLSCTECRMILNRDVNGAMNIQHLLYNHLNRMHLYRIFSKNSFFRFVYKINFDF